MKTYFTFMKESHTLYHKSYTDAINAALAHHKDKEGLNVSDEDRDTHIAMGPRKPAEGETVERHIPATDKNGKRRIIHIQVYNKGGPTPYELNAYSSGDRVAEETVDVSEGLGDRYTNNTIGKFSELKNHANKLGPKHKDYDDLMIAASHMAFGNMDHLTKHLKKLNPDVRDKIKEYMKEEVEQVDEISSATLISYSQQAHNQIKGNQPADPDKLRKRTNREQGIKLAFDKHYQVRTKVPATINEEEPLAEQVSFKKTISGHHIHHNGERVGEIIKTNSMGSLGYSVRFRGKEVSSEKSLSAAKESAKYHLTSSESPLKEEVELDEAAVPVDHKQKMREIYGPGQVTADVKNGMISHTDKHGETNSHAYDPDAEKSIGHHVGTVTVGEEVELDEMGKKGPYRPISPGTQNLRTAQAATKGDRALDKQYGYGTTKGGVSPIAGKRREQGFGAVANFNSAAAALRAKRMGEPPKTQDAEVHKGWGKTVDQMPAANPEKQAARKKLQQTPFYALSKGEKEKDTILRKGITKEKIEPLAEISAALAMRASRAATKEVGTGKSKREDKLIGLQKTADEKFRKMLGRSSSAKVATTSEETVLDEVSKGTVGSYLEKLNTLKRSELKARGTKPTLAANKVFGKDVKVPATDE